MTSAQNLDFKLIAVLPLKGCSAKFSKRLEIGQIYQFYQEYSIALSPDKSSVVSLLANDGEKAAANLYKLDNGIFVNISAIVGKNGTGKSTLFELFYRAIYLLSIGNESIGKPLESAVDELRKRLVWQKRELGTLLRKTDLPIEYYPTISKKDFDKTNKLDKDIFVAEMLRSHEFKFNSQRAGEINNVPKLIAAELNSSIMDTEAALKHEIEQHKSYRKNFNVSILFESDGKLMEFQVLNGKAIFSEFSSTGEKNTLIDGTVKLEDLFYTISLNYSHHGLNSLVTGRWIKKLFHKNDGYRTPLVMNPMRDFGNFNINQEIGLSNERLMSTLVYDFVHNARKPLLNKYTVTKFIFRRKRTGHQPVFSRKDFDQLEYGKLIRGHYGIDERFADLPNAEAAINYLSAKIGKVARGYDFMVKEGVKGPEALKLFLQRENSHVTKKIRQTVNYLKQRNVGNLWDPFGERDPVEVILTPGNLKTYLASFGGDYLSMDPATLIDYALPGFFEIDFEFSYGKSKNIKLSDMSSGEQQLIFNGNAILYHLYNIQSVFEPALTDGEEAVEKLDRPAYKSVNIVLDEMELYYHPEMQRRFVSDLMFNLSRLGKDKGIIGINVCILTHSPFVLSDIPSQNILQLFDKEDTRQAHVNQSFASNIHDLLKNEFLLEKGFMGEFARQKINLVIDSLKVHEKVFDLDYLGLDDVPVGERNKLLKMVNVDKAIQWHHLMRSGECQKCIAIVGEPVLYQSLIELYLSVFPKHKESLIERQLAFLTRLKGGRE